MDVTHETAATFDSDMEHSVGQLPPPLLAAYPHATDEEARQARLGLERDLRFGWDMWAWARLQARTGQRSLSSTTRSDSSRRSLSAHSTQGGARATSPSFGMSSTIWTRSRGTGQRQTGEWPRKCPATGSTSRSRAIRTARAFPLWPAFTNTESKVQYLGDPITVGGVANISGLTVFDSVYATVRGKPFAAR